MFFGYEFYYWLGWLAITVLATKKFGYLGLFIAHCIIFVSVFASDLHYVSQLMSQPEWDDNPDLDITFLVGVIFRTIVINVLLLPTGILGKYFHNKVNTTGI